MKDIETLKEARRTLYRGAKHVAAMRGEYWQWLDSAPQWALDTVSQREIDAIAYIVWGVS